MRKCLLILFLLFGLAYQATAESLSQKPIPIVIYTFEIVGDEPKDDIGSIITNNLNRSGLFDVIYLNRHQFKDNNQIDFDSLQRLNQEVVVFGKISQISSKVYHGEIYVFDVLTQKSLLAKKFRFSDGGVRRISHIMSDEIYSSLFGRKGSFDTRKIFVKVDDNYLQDERIYRLQISDSDFENPQTLVRSTHLIDFAKLSPDGRKVAYVSNKNAALEVFIKDLYLKTTATKIPTFEDNIALAPSWHPNGTSLLLTLSKNGNQDIYSYIFETKELHRMTSNPAVDIAASYSPEGNHIVFTSNRLSYQTNQPKAIFDRKIEDKAQIFIADVYTGKAKQVPIEGDYNAGAVYSPDGEKLALIHGVGSKKKLALYDLTSERLQVIASIPDINSGVFIPQLSFSANGDSIYFEKIKDNTKYLVELNLHNFKTFETEIGIDANDDKFFTVAEIIEKDFLSLEELDSYSDDALIEIAKQMSLDFMFKFDSKGVLTNRERLILAISVHSYKFDSEKAKPSTPEVKIPPNAYAANSTIQGWKCNTGFYQKNNSCTKLPENAYSTESGWECNSGYRKSGSWCLDGDIQPPNSTMSGSRWYCNSGYYRSSDYCYKLPENAEKKQYGDGYICKSGYYKNWRDLCSKLPENALPKQSSDGYICKSGFIKKDSKCVPKEIWIDGNKYVGELKNGQPDGQGTLYFSDDEFYVGGWKNGKMHGKGVLTSEGIVFEGEWKLDEPVGDYTITLIDGTKIIGDAKDDFKLVTILYPNGDKYIGGLNDDFELDGPGEMIFADGTKIEGNWLNGELQYTDNNSNTSISDVIPAASGSGFAVTDDGYIVTNHHVIDGCQNVEIINKGKAIPSTVVSFDTNNDLALLKSDFRPSHTFPLSRKNPYTLMEIYVAGFPFGYDISTSIKITKGIISSLSGIGNNFSQMQIDAAIQPGNSGGPIIDDKGNVVGVAVAKLDLEKMVDTYGVVPEGTNFGIKSNVVINFLESNNIDLIEVNTKKLGNEALGKTITEGTYYISCLMTMAQIQEMKERKVLFSNID